MAKKRKFEEEPQILLEEVPVEKEIAEIQLERLRMISRERLLSFEEVRIYDLLTKNLLLSKGKATDIVGSAKRLPASNIETEKLIEIAKAIPEATAKKSLDTVDNDDEKN